MKKRDTSKRLSKLIGVENEQKNGVEQYLVPRKSDNYSCGVSPKNRDRSNRRVKKRKKNTKRYNIGVPVGHDHIEQEESQKKQKLNKSFGNYLTKKHKKRKKNKLKNKNHDLEESSVLKEK